MPKQSRPIANKFTSVDFDCLQERFLDAVPSIGVIAHQSMNGAQYDAHVLAYNRLPIRHLRTPVNKPRFKIIVDLNGHSVTKNLL